MQGRGFFPAKLVEALQMPSAELQCSPTNDCQVRCRRPAPRPALPRCCPSNALDRSAIEKTFSRRQALTGCCMLLSWVAAPGKGWPALAAKADAAPTSLRNDQPVSVTFSNKTEEPVRVYWSACQALSQCLPSCVPNTLCYSICTLLMQAEL